MVSILAEMCNVTSYNKKKTAEKLPCQRRWQILMDWYRVWRIFKVVDYCSHWTCMENI